MFEGATVNKINKLKSIHYKLGIIPVIASFRPLFWFSWKLANRLSGQNLSSTGTVRGILAMRTLSYRCFLKSRLLNILT